MKIEQKKGPSSSPSFVAIQATPCVGDPFF